MRPLASFALLLLWVTVACGPTTSSARGESTPSGTPCPTTTPPPVELAPPPTSGIGPNPTLVFRAGPDTFLYGNEALIVARPTDGTLHPSDPQRGLTGGVKFGWWRIAHGDLAVATRRLDPAGPSLPADVPGGYGESGFQATGLNFPEPGCWRVTGTVSGTALTSVVSVAAR